MVVGLQGFSRLQSRPQSTVMQVAHLPRRLAAASHCLKDFEYCLGTLTVHLLRRPHTRCKTAKCICDQICLTARMVVPFAPNTKGMDYASMCKTIVKE